MPTRPPTVPTYYPTRKPTTSPSQGGSQRQTKSGKRKGDDFDLGKWVGIIVGIIAGLCCIVCLVFRRMSAQDVLATREANAMMRAASRSPLLGMHVRIIKLKDRTEFNGATGIAKKWIKDKQCYIVVLDKDDDDDDDARCVGMSEENLVLVDKNAKRIKNSAADKAAKALKESLDDLREKLLQPIRAGMSVADIFGRIDDDASHSLDAKEFSRAVHAMQSKDAYMDIDAKAAFKHIDKDNSGSITVSELTRFLSEGSGSGEGPAYEFTFITDRSKEKPQYLIEITKNTIMYCRLGPFPMEIICSQAMTAVAEFVTAIEEENFVKKHAVIDVTGHRYNLDIDRGELVTTKNKKRKAKPQKFSWKPAEKKQAENKDDKKKKNKKKKVKRKDSASQQEKIAKMLRNAFLTLDADQSGEVDLDEFQKVCESDDRDAVRALFHLIDHDGSGAFDETELVEVLQTNREAMALARQFPALKKLVVSKGKRRRSSRKKAKRKRTLAKLESMSPDEQSKLSAASADAAAISSAASRRRRRQKKKKKKREQLKGAVVAVEVAVDGDMRGKGNKKRGKKRRGTVNKSMRRRGTKQTLTKSLKPVPSQSNLLSLVQAEGPTSTQHRLEQRRKSVVERLALFKKRQAMREATAAAAEAEAEAAAKAAKEAAAAPAPTVGAALGDAVVDDDMVIEFG